MRVKIQYENEIQEIELNAEETEEMWVSLDLKEEDGKDKETLIQEAVDEQWNKPEYNIYHRETRHIDQNPVVKLSARKGDVVSSHNTENFDVFQYAGATPDCTEKVFNNIEYEDICRMIRKVLKPNVADAFIAVYLDDVPVKEYAEKLHVTEGSISQKLHRAREKLKKYLGNRKISPSEVATH